MAKKPFVTLNLGTNGLKVTSGPPPMAGQAGCLQGQDRLAVTHPSSRNARCARWDTKGQWAVCVEPINKARELVTRHILHLAYDVTSGQTAGEKALRHFSHFLSRFRGYPKTSHWLSVGKACLAWGHRDCWYSLRSLRRRRISSLNSSGRGGVMSVRERGDDEAVIASWRMEVKSCTSRSSWSGDSAGVGGGRCLSARWFAKRCQLILVGRAGRYDMIHI
ncbi:hypothetical protein J6590_086886 [Homalodisca vitripennis]|nr:hypothetical protein J6590_086886 [Homalodisca vitripennis]